MLEAKANPSHLSGLLLLLIKLIIFFQVCHSMLRSQVLPKLSIHIRSINAPGSDRGHSEWPHSSANPTQRPIQLSRYPSPHFPPMPALGAAQDWYFWPEAARSTGSPRAGPAAKF